jgi:hypothetical protein
MERREFLGWLGTASVAALSMSAAGTGAQGGGKSATPSASPGASVPPAPAAASTSPAPPPSPDAQDLMSIARRRYGAHLSDEQAAELLAALDRGLQGSAALRKAKLANGDEPDFVFRAIS